MTPEEKAKLLTDGITEKMNEITQAVIKQLGEKEDTSTDDASASSTPAEKTEKSVKTTPEEKTEGLDVEKITKSFETLQEQITDLSKKMDEGVKTSEEVAQNNIAEKQAEIQNGMAELVKSMGIDPESVDLSFAIKEKKKAEVSDDNNDDKFEKNLEENDVEGDDFEKAFAEASDEEKTEALNLYFKNLLKV